jgi:pimeloyl-ACP methyl ester carboxylesterase
MTALARILGMVALFGGLANTTPAAAQGASPATNPGEACRALAGAVVPASRIGLPTSGAKVTSAVLQPATRGDDGETPEPCTVLVDIGPASVGGQPIHMQLNLPSAWNGKAVQMGGGGLDGVLVTADGPSLLGSREPSPLSLGYATFGDDGGHHVASQFNPEQQAAAFLSDEVLANYAASEHVKKTRDVAEALIRLRYGRPARRTYFIGASYGGREALAAAQKWGGDYDGVIAFFPAAGGIPTVVELGRLSRALARPGAFPDRAKQALLHRAAITACDADDGAADGVISSATTCRFDVATLRCPSGADEGDTCLSNAQIAALRVIGSDLRLAYPLASGETGIAGYHVFADVKLDAPIAGLGSTPPTSPSTFPDEAIHNLFYDVFVRGMLMRDLHANALDFDPEHPGRYQSRMSALSPLFQASDPDLSKLARHGGKLILVHGTEDALLPVGWSEAYYRAVAGTMGRSAVERFMRFYAVPGYGHFVGEFVPEWDSLTELDHWVESGAAPAIPIATDANPENNGRTRPLCEYPAQPRYNGSGDIDKAVNFHCVGGWRTQPLNSQDRP